MADDVLYERFMPHGPAVRIRRTSAPGKTPVTAVLEVERRAGTPRAGIGTPPPLMECEGPSEDDVVIKLAPHAKDDRTIIQLMHDMGLR